MALFGGRQRSMPPLPRAGVSSMRSAHEEHTDGFDRLLRLRSTAASAEQRETEAIAALAACARSSAPRPQWAQRRSVPQPKMVASNVCASTRITAEICPVLINSSSCSSGVSPRSGKPTADSSVGSGGTTAKSPRGKDVVVGASGNADGEQVRRMFGHARRGVSQPAPQLTSSSDVRCAELEALRVASLAEDEALLKQLGGPGPGGCPERNTNRCPPPRVRKPADEPPSLRAWRRHRQEGTSPQVHSLTKDEQKEQVTRLKENLFLLADEVKQLQDLMIQDAEELQENCLLIQSELRRSRGVGGPAASPSSQAPERIHLVNVVPDTLSTVSTAVGTPTSSEVGNHVPSVSVIGSRAVTLSAALEVQECDSRWSTLKPLPAWVMCRLGALSGNTADQLSEAGLTLIPQTCMLRLVEYLSGATSLVMGSLNRVFASALHTRTGRRVWPHVEISVGRSDPSQVARLLRAAVSISSICSVSVFGGTDGSVATLLNAVFGIDKGPLSCSGACESVAVPAITALRMSCSSKGKASAVEKYRRYGDFMGIGDSGFAAVSEHLKTRSVRSTLRVLDLAWNHLGDDSMMFLRDSWPEALTELHLAWNSVGPGGAAHLCQAICHKNAAALRSLDLRSNPLGNQGVGSICDAVAAHAGLQWLGLGETLLQDAGAIASLPQLRGHPALTGLDIGENPLTDASCEALATVIAEGPMLRKLCLRGFLFEPKRISDTGGRVLAHAVGLRAIRAKESSRSVPVEVAVFDLDLDYQQVGCQTVVTLARCCGAWSHLSVFNTDVSTMGITTLANALRQQPVLAGSLRLNVAQCRIGAGAVMLLRNLGLARLDAWGQREAG